MSRNNLSSNQNNGQRKKKAPPPPPPRRNSLATSSSVKAPPPPVAPKPSRTSSSSSFRASSEQQVASRANNREFSAGFNSQRSSQDMNISSSGSVNSVFGRNQVVDSSSSSSLSISQGDLLRRRESLRSISETQGRRPTAIQDYNKPELLEISVALLQNVARGNALARASHYNNRPIGLEEAFEIVKKSLKYAIEYNPQTNKEAPAINSDQIERINRIAGSEIEDQELQGYFAQQDFLSYISPAITKITNLELEKLGIYESPAVGDERSSSSSAFNQEIRPYDRSSSSSSVFARQQQEQINIDNIDDLPPPPPELLAPPPEIDPEYQELTEKLLGLMYNNKRVTELESDSRYSALFLFENDLYRFDENNNKITPIKLNEDGSEKTLETEEIDGLIQGLEQARSARTSSSSVREQTTRRDSSALSQQQSAQQPQIREPEIRSEDRLNNPFFDYNPDSSPNVRYSSSVQDRSSSRTQ